MDRTAARFWSKIDCRGPAECWPWKGKVSSTGYGTFWSDGKNRKAHRVAFVLSGGSIPEGLWVLHSCDNRPCCNPAHLRAGTPTDNVRDMVERGRQAVLKGESHPNAVLTEDMARAIWDLRRRGWPESGISEKLRCRRSAVSAVLSTATWAHVAPVERSPFLCPCGKVPDRGRNQHYQTCKAWQAWAAEHEPELLALVRGRRRNAAELLSRAYALIREAGDAVPQEIRERFADVIDEAKRGTRPAALVAALEAAP